VIFGAHPPPIMKHKPISVAAEKWCYKRNSR